SPPLGLFVARDAIPRNPVVGGRSISTTATPDTVSGLPPLARTTRFRCIESCVTKERQAQLASFDTPQDSLAQRGCGVVGLTGLILLILLQDVSVVAAPRERIVRNGYADAATHPAAGDEVKLVFPQEGLRPEDLEALPFRQFPGTSGSEPRQCWSRG